MATKYGGNIAIHLHERPSSDPYFFNCTYVYVKCDSTFADHWQQRFFRCMGGKTHVICQCNKMPFIPTNTWREMKQKCIKCHRRESYVCCSISCSARLCKKCYDSCHIEDVTTIDPSDYIMNDMDDEDVDDLDDDDSLNVSSVGSCVDQLDDDDEVNEHHDISDSHNIPGILEEQFALADDQFEDHVDESDPDFILFNDFDGSHDITQDNIIDDHGFFTTNSGDTVRGIIHHDRMEQVSGHVLLNQAAVCMRRFGRAPICGTQVQRHFIQRLASSIPGESSPLLYMESSLFTRIFYHSSSYDSFSILGALPLFAYSANKTNPFGLESFVKMNCTRVTSYGSLSSSNVHYIKFLHDVMCNKALCHTHSRDVTERGFVVDTKSSTGLSVRNKGESILSDSIDSHQMVRSLSASQEYIKYDLFLTFTCCQKDHPGTCNLFQWKSSKEWAYSIPEYESMSEIEHTEFDNSMEELYGLISFRNWMESWQLMLDFIVDDISSHGACATLFSRTEYQPESGNLSHEHIILALKKDSLNSLTNDQLNNLIATNVMEIVKFDQIEKLISDGLLSCPEDIDGIVQDGWRKLKHTCGQRCLIRIGPGDGPENFKCRKQHAVKDSPDSTCHQFIKLPCNLSDVSKDILIRAGIFIPPTHEGGRDEQYTIPYFQPTRHMAPCITNAQCNMSPIIPEYFMMFKSMHNAQVISQSNGTSKYICKYVTKIDEGNKAILFSNSRTEDIRVGSQFLHNTKIATSAINESKAFQSKRYKNHPTGTEFPDIYSLHLILGYPEVTTNIPFIPNNTGPFELRTQHTVRLNQCGNVIHNNEANDVVGELFISYGD